MSASTIKQPLPSLEDSSTSNYPGGRDGALGHPGHRANPTGPPRSWTVFAVIGPRTEEVSRLRIHQLVRGRNSGAKLLIEFSPTVLAISSSQRFFCWRSITSGLRTALWLKIVFVKVCQSQRPGNGLLHRDSTTVRSRCQFLWRFKKILRPQQQPIF